MRWAITTSLLGHLLQLVRRDPLRITAAISWAFNSYSVWSGGNNRETWPRILRGSFEGHHEEAEIGIVRFRISPMPLKSASGIVAIVALFGTSVQAADLPEAPSSAPIPKAGRQYRPQLGPVHISDLTWACVTTRWTRM